MQTACALAAPGQRDIHRARVQSLVHSLLSQHLAAQGNCRVERIAGGVQGCARLAPERLAQRPQCFEGVGNQPFFAEKFNAHGVERRQFSGRFNFGESDFLQCLRSGHRAT